MHSTTSSVLNHRDAMLRLPVMSWEEKLFLAVNREDARTVRALIKKGVSVNEIHASGRTPLGLAAQLGNIEILNILLETAAHSDIKSICAEEKCSKDQLDSEHWSEGTSSKDRAAVCLNEKNFIIKVSHSKKKTNSKSLKFGNDSDSSENEKSDEDFKNKKNNKKCRNTTRNDFEVDHYMKSFESCSSCGKTACCELSSENLQGQGNVYSTAGFENEDVKRKVEPNQGYYIVVHKEDSSRTNQPEDEVENFCCDGQRTPDDMDNLEWDSELHDEEFDSKLEDSEESDSWIDLYCWYADHLAKSCAVDLPVLQNVSCRLDVNQLDMYRRSPMHYAAEQGKMEVLHLLVNAGCSVDIGDADDVTPLHLAASRDYPDAVTFLISCGAKVNRKTIDGTGPLHMVAARGFMKTAGVLLEHGANVNALDRSDRTPLLLAVSRGLQEMVKLLISHRAKVNVEDILGYTPLCQAVWQQEKEIVRLLLKAGAKLTHSDRLLHSAILHRCTDIAELLISAGSIINLRDDNGDTPLIIAARSGQADMVNLLLNNGAMASYPNGLTGTTPLHEAVEYLRPSQYNRFREILLSLLNHQGPTGLLNIQSASSCDIPLVRALVYDKDHILIILIQYGADVNLLQQHTPVVSESYLQKRPNRWIIAQLMIYGGLNLWLHTPDIRINVKYANDSPASWIAFMKFNPMSLSALCRLKFRSLYGENLYKAVNRSGLPVSLRKFIMLEDIINADEFVCGNV